MSKAAATSKSSSQEAIDAVAKMLDGAIGGNSKAIEIAGHLNTGYPPLNERLSGDPALGLPYGRIVEIFGDSGTGKTAFAVQLIIEAQKQGGAGMLMDHEHAFNLDLAVGNGLNTQSPFWVYKRPETWEESNEMAMKAAQIIRASKLLKPEAPIVCVFDSVAAMIPMSMLYDPKKPGVRRPISSLTMNDTSALSRVSSNTLKLINLVMSELNVICIYLNQVRTKIGVVWGDPTTTPGGSSFAFYATTRLQLSRSLVKEAVNGEKTVTGQIIKFHTKKNRMERPFQDIDLLLTFPMEGGAFFDHTTSLLGLLVGEGKLKIKTLGNGQKRVVWTDGTEYTLKDFTKKVKAEGLYPEMTKLYSTPTTSAPVLTTDEAAALALDAL